MSIKPGDIIYVDSSMSIDHGEDDFQGGKATIGSVSKGMSAGQMVDFITIKERPGHSYNWEQVLSKKQDKLKEQFGDNWAHPDPDYNSYDYEPFYDPDPF